MIYLKAIAKGTGLLFPLSALIDVLVAILRGFADVKANVYFKNILVIGIRIILVISIIILGFAFKGVLLAYLNGTALIAVALIYYARKKNTPKFTQRKETPTFNFTFLPECCLPFVSKLFAHKQYKEINKLYRTVTQWTFFTLPAILVMFFAPKAVLHLFLASNISQQA